MRANLDKRHAPLRAVRVLVRLFEASEAFYADIIGKSLAFLQPSWVRWIVCDDAAPIRAPTVPPTDTPTPHQNAYLRGYHYAQSGDRVRGSVVQGHPSAKDRQDPSMPNYMFHCPESDAG